MKRCAICNSTEGYDELAALGLPVDPIRRWYTYDDDICDRCHDPIQEVLSEYTIEDELKGEENDS